MGRPSSVRRGRGRWLAAGACVWAAIRPLSPASWLLWIGIAVLKALGGLYLLHQLLG